MKKTKQDKLKNFTANRFYQNQSMLIQHLFEQGIFSIDDIVNFYPDNSNEIKQIKIISEQPAEIMEWWTCDPWLMNQLEKRGEAILETDYGDWWGRQATGQAIFLDAIIEEIYNDYN